MITPDPTQNKTGSTQNYESSLGDCGFPFTYAPKTTGTHKLGFFWNVVSGGVSRALEKQIDISAVPYIKVDPYIIQIPVAYDNSSTISPVFNVGETDRAVVNFKLSEADEPILPIEMRNIKYESDIQDAEFRFFDGSLNQIKIANTKDFIGKHTFTIKEIGVVGKLSGQYRYVSGLPLTINFEVKDIWPPEIISIKTTHTYMAPTRDENLYGWSGPGEIGYFKIRAKPNSWFKMISCRIRVEGNASYRASLGGSKDCGASRISYEEGGRVLTDNNGVTTEQYIFSVTDLSTSENKLKFYVEDLKVSDSAWGLTRTVLNPPVFELNIIRP